MNTTTTPQPKYTERKGTSQRTAAVALLLVQIFAIGMFMQATTFATCAAMIAFIGWLAPQYGMLREIDRTRWFLFSGVLFGLKSYFAPSDFDVDIKFVNTELAYEIGCYCIVIQLIVLFMKRYVERLPLWILGVSVVALIFISDIRVNRISRTVMLVTVACFLITWVAFAASSRTAVFSEKSQSWFRFSLSWGVLIFAIVAGTTISVLLHRHERNLENVLTAYLALGDPSSAQTGFSARGGLSDVSEWKRVNANTVTLRVTSESSPGYLRGKVFDTFERQRWTIESPSVALLPVTESPLANFSGKGESVFLLRSSNEENPTSKLPLRIWPVDGDSAGHFFLPLNAEGIACRVDSVYIDGHGIPTRTDHGDIHPYSAFASKGSHAAKNESPNKLDLALPSKIDERVSHVLNELALDGLTNRQKMQTVSSFFESNFQYKLGISIKRGEDRLGYFLGERLPAHCEYFATATTVLLRMAGVPARYVTGFVCQEKNPVDGTWLARRQDAHAWVEAYDDVLQEWVTVESTPSAGVPEERNANSASYLWEWILHWLRYIQYCVQQGDVWSLLWSLLQPLLLLLLFGILMVGLAQVFMLLNGKTIEKQPTEIWLDPRLQTERIKMDRYVAKYGIERAANESILKFANRIEQRVTIPNPNQVKQWYQQYLTFRFDTRLIENEQLVTQQIEMLTQQRKSIIASHTKVPAHA